MFRERIPIRNRWGRVIAFTARYIGGNSKTPKYINSANSIIYTKGETVFGIDRASRMKEADNVIIVEGAPDVLRLQSIGFDITVAWQSQAMARRRDAGTQRGEEEKGVVDIFG